MKNLWKTNDILPIRGIGKDYTVMFEPVIYGEECLIETNTNEIYLCYAAYDSQVADETIPFYFYNDENSFTIDEVKRWCYIKDIKNIK